MLIHSSLSSALTLTEQRSVYAQAVELQAQGRWLQATQKAKIIADYPLSYLLDYQFLRKNFNPHYLPAVQDFIKHNPEHKISNDLQREYLSYLAKNKYWSEFTTFYPRLPHSTDLKCYYFQAKIAQNKAQEIWSDVQKTWLTGTSLPNACDPVLQYYFAKNKISQQLIWQRFKLAYLKNQTSLLRYLITLMDEDKPTRALANELLQLNRKPHKILKSNLFSHHKQSHYTLLLPTIKKLARKDIDLGMDAYHFYNKKINFNTTERKSLKKYFARRILIKDKNELLPWLDKELPNLQNDDLVEQRIRYAIKLNNWADIESWLSHLSPEKKQISRWLYWQARVFENKHQQKEADKLYKKLASKRTYYGFLAAQKLGLDYQFNAQIVSEKDQSLTHLHTQLAHIEELHFQQHMHLLKREWENLLKKQTAELQNQLGLYAAKKGWAHLSVVASIRSKSWDALNIRFPEVKPKLFQYTANQYQLPSSYIYAITRQESSFDEFANSPAGAKGYMQLMPGTASETARKIGLKNYKGKAQLSEGHINLQLGSAYLNMLLKRCKGNRILATASYTAGPYRVDTWRRVDKEVAEASLSMDR